MPNVRHMKNGSLSQSINKSEDPRRSIGRRGEVYAATFLRSHGFTVIAQNWRCLFGEIDLIVKREDEVRFIEVKTRRTRTYGLPQESVTSQKLRHLARSIEWWIAHCHIPPRRYQADVIALLLEQGEWRVEWIEGVL